MSEETDLDDERREIYKSVKRIVELYCDYITTIEAANIWAIIKHLQQTWKPEKVKVRDLDTCLEKDGLSDRTEDIHNETFNIFWRNVGYTTHERRQLLLLSMNGKITPKDIRKEMNQAYPDMYYDFQ